MNFFEVVNDNLMKLIEKQEDNQNSKENKLDLEETIEVSLLI